MTEELAEPAPNMKVPAPADEAVPSLVWFDRWSIILVVAVGAAIALASALQFQVGAPWLTGFAETSLFTSLGVVLVAVVGWTYTAAKFWAQISRGEHVTRTERRRRAWAYALAFGAAAFVVVAEVLSPHNKLWLLAYVPAGGLVALGFTLRPKKRVRKRRRQAAEASTGGPQR